MAVLLIGYDVERIEGKVPGDKWVGFKIEKDVTKKFLEKAYEIHTSLDTPCTFFLVGKVAEAHIEILQKVAKNPLFDLQQHTYSHIALKTVVEESEDNIYIEGKPLEIISEEVSKTNDLLKRYFDVNCIGLTGPYGYYRGLSDRPDILKILHESGIRFTRTYLRNERDYQPVSWDVQPFWYHRQGFSEILEIPVCWWHDCQWRRRYGWGKTNEYLEALKRNIALIVEKDLVWSYVQHDWSSLKEDPDMSIVKGFIGYAKKMGVKLITHKEFYFQQKSKLCNK